MSNFYSIVGCIYVYMYLKHPNYDLRCQSLWNWMHVRQLPRWPAVNVYACVLSWVGVHFLVYVSLYACASLVHGNVTLFGAGVYIWLYTYYKRALHGNCCVCLYFTTLIGLYRICRRLHSCSFHAIVLWEEDCPFTGVSVYLCYVFMYVFANWLWTCIFLKNMYVSIVVFCQGLPDCTNNVRVCAPLCITLARLLHDVWWVGAWRVDTCTLGMVEDSSVRVKSMPSWCTWVQLPLEWHDYTTCLQFDRPCTYTYYTWGEQNHSGCIVPDVEQSTCICVYVHDICMYWEYICYRQGLVCWWGDMLGQTIYHRYGL